MNFNPTGSDRHREHCHPFCINNFLNAALNERFGDGQFGDSCLFHEYIGGSSNFHCPLKTLK